MIVFCFVFCCFTYGPSIVLAQSIERVPADANEDANEAARVDAEIATISRRVPRFKVLNIPRSVNRARTWKIPASRGLTIDQLRGLELDENPPLVLGLLPTHANNMTDHYPSGTAPYVAEGILPFRFEFFNCEFHYGGWYNRGLIDYAALHGFQIIRPYFQTPQDLPYMPRETRFLASTSFDWNGWFRQHQIPQGRYDLLADKTLDDLELPYHNSKTNLQKSEVERYDALMLDLESPVLSPDQLRSQTWYPATASPPEQAAFERRYFDGYARTFTSVIEAHRQRGWKNISVYGWAPFGRTWGGLETPKVADGTVGADLAWQQFGKKIYDQVDIVNNSVYCFYWSSRNVAYTLANIDENRRRVHLQNDPKPIRPYYWTLLHGGGGGWRWWRGMPLANEEQRAIMAMAFFTGVDGLDLWNWSGVTNHHVVPPPVIDDNHPQGVDLMVGETLKLVPTSELQKKRTESFKRYDVLHVGSYDEETDVMTFQKIREGEPELGLTDKFPKFQAKFESLQGYFRPASESVAAAIEGMALIKPFEFTLSHGTPQIDVPAQQQFQDNLPVIRRVTHGQYHIVITYDPNVIYGGAPRQIELPDFAGQTGLTVVFPADEQTRIFLLRD